MDSEKEEVLARGIFERIGLNNSVLKFKIEKGNVEKTLEFQEKIDHKKALEIFMDTLSGEETISEVFQRIFAIGHRVVHGGKYFSKATVINDDVVSKIKKLIGLAPLHNKPSLDVILACRGLFRSIKVQIAVFDTSFYFDLPEKAYMYAIPYRFYEKYGIRKYGFHGMSHKFVSEKCAKMINKDIVNLKIISCHLGNGSSITAIKNGKAIDTSMGFTPLDGIMMGTRCGSLDPAVVTFIQERENLNFKDIDNILNKESGLLGISGISSDARDIIEAERNNEKRAILASEMMRYQIIKHIGAYSAAMNGLDALIFTAGIGENIEEYRIKVCKELEFLGIKIDEKLNKEKSFGENRKISKQDSKVDVFVIETNEELMMAREVVSCLGNV